MSSRSHAILHCAAVPTGWHLGKTALQVLQTITGWHLERGFKGIGYHFIIMPDGETIAGRALPRDGAHTAGHNRGTLGVLLIESAKVTRIGDFSDYFTRHQMRALRCLLRHQAIKTVAGHNDYSNKLCPGFRVRSEDFLS